MTARRRQGDRAMLHRQDVLYNICVVIRQALDQSMSDQLYRSSCSKCTMFDFGGSDPFMDLAVVALAASVVPVRCAVNRRCRLHVKIGSLQKYGLVVANVQFNAVQFS